MRRRVFPQCLFLAACLGLAPQARADVFVVDAGGGGDFTTLGAAVAVAVTGDTLLLRPGNYAEAGTLVIDGKALNILGEWTPADPPAVMITPGLMLTNMPQGKHSLLMNLSLHGADSSPAGNATEALVLQHNLGHVRLQNCHVKGGSGVVNSSPWGAGAVRAINSISTAFVGCRVEGGDGQFSHAPGIKAGTAGTGIVLLGAQVLVYESHVKGGDGGDAAPGAEAHAGHGAVGFFHDTGSLLGVASRLEGGRGGHAVFGGSGGHGLKVGPTGIVWLMGGMELLAGNGGSGSTADGPDGEALLDEFGTATDFLGHSHRFDLSSPLREGAVGQIEFGGDGNDAAFVFYSLSLHQIPYPGHHGVLMLMPAAMLGPLVIGPPGDLQLPFTAPTLPVGLEILHLHIQPAYVGPGGTGLGPARVLTILDESF